MSRVLAVFPVDVGRRATLGLVEKARGLSAAAAAAGHAVTAVLADGRRLSVADAGDWPPPPPTPTPPPTPYDGNKVWEARNALYRFAGFWDDVSGALRGRRYDALWVRAHPVSQAQRCLLADACGRGVRVAYDIPTYPFEREHKGAFRRLAGIVTSPLADIAPAVDRFVTLSEHARIEQVPTVRVRNGVSVPRAPRRALGEGGPFRLLGLGQWSDYHGLDRLFRGAATHPGHYVFRIAGTGPAVPAYAALADRLGLDVTWLPAVFGEERARLLSWADAGIGCLAIHRKGVYPDQALKHRVYAAAGLPFVCTEADPHWRHTAGVWQLPADESRVSPVELHSSLDGFRQNAAALVGSLREAARATSWRHAYAPLFDYFHDFT